MTHPTPFSSSTEAITLQLTPASPGPQLRMVSALSTSSIARASRENVFSEPPRCPFDERIDRYVESRPNKGNHLKVMLDGESAAYRLNNSSISWRDRHLGEATCAPLAPLGCILLMHHLARQEHTPLLLRLTDPMRLRYGSRGRMYHEMTPYLPTHMEALSNYLEGNQREEGYYTWTQKTGELLLKEEEGAAYWAKEVELTLSEEAQENATSIGLVLHEVAFQMIRADDSRCEERRLIELYVPDWEDGKTMYVPQLLAVLFWMEKYAPASNPVVHCSAGVSRTGVVMGCRALLAELRFRQTIPTLKEIRETLLTQRCFIFGNEQEAMLNEAIDLAIKHRSIEELERRTTQLATEYRFVLQQDGEISPR